jgi:DNA polymerase III delta subunit
MIYVVLGPDRLLARSEVNKHVAHHDPGGQNTFRFDADSDPLTAVMNGVATLSFFGDPRVVVATGYLAKLKPSASGSKGGSSKSSKSKSNVGEVEGILSNATNAVLVIHEPALATVPAAVKSLLPESASVSVNQPQRGQALIDITIASFQKRNCSIDRDTVRHLLDRLFPSSWTQAASNPAFDTPPDIETLVNEIEKLSIAAGSEEVTEELIDELTTQATTEQTFPLLDAVVAGQTIASLRELASVSPVDDERTRMLAQVLQQVEYAVAASQPGRPSDPLQAGRDLGMSNPNRMKPVLRAVSESRIPMAELLSAALEADRRLKRGLAPGPDDALYSLFLSSHGRRRE